MIWVIGQLLFNGDIIYNSQCSVSFVIKGFALHIDIISNGHNLAHINISQYLFQIHCE